MVHDPDISMERNAIEASDTRELHTYLLGWLLPDDKYLSGKYYEESFLCAHGKRAPGFFDWEIRELVENTLAAMGEAEVAPSLTARVGLLIVRGTRAQHQRVALILQALRAVTVVQRDLSLHTTKPGLLSHVPDSDPEPESTPIAESTGEGAD